MARALRTLCFALIGLIAAGFASAHAASAATRACSRPSVVNGAKARLVVKEGSLFGCVRVSRRAVLVTGPQDDYGYWRKPRLAGTFAALELVLDYKCRTVDIQVTNLRTGVSRTFRAGSSSYVSSAHGCDNYGSPTTDMVLRSDGAIAFIAGDEVVRGTGGGKIVILDRGPTVDPTSLGLTRSGLVTWWSDGRPRSAVLPWRDAVAQRDSSTRLR